MAIKNFFKLLCLAFGALISTHLNAHASPVQGDDILRCPDRITVTESRDWRFDYDFNTNRAKGTHLRGGGRPEGPIYWKSCHNSIYIQLRYRGDYSRSCIFYYRSAPLQLQTRVLPVDGYCALVSGAFLPFSGYAFGNGPSSDGLSACPNSLTPYGGVYNRIRSPKWYFVFDLQSGRAKRTDYRGNIVEYKIGRHWCAEQTNHYPHNSRPQLHFTNVYLELITLQTGKVAGLCVLPVRHDRDYIGIGGGCRTTDADDILLVGTISNIDWPKMPIN